MPTKKAQDAPSAKAPERRLTLRQQRFIEEYTTDFNGTQAAIRAGYSAKTAKVIAHELLTKPYITAPIAARRANLAETTEINREFVLKQWALLVQADPNELTQYRRTNCRYCFGVGFAKQWVDEDEYAAACAEAEREEWAIPSDEGGYGFDPKERPHPKCPECNGEGLGQTYFGDTRHLSPGGKALFAGVKQTKQGIEILMNDKQKALDNIARHLGMFNDKLTLAGDEQNPVAVLLKAVQGATIKPGGD